MQKIVVLILSLIAATQTLSAQQIDKQFFDLADRFFEAHVSDGQVDYKNVKNNSELKALVSAIQNADISNASESVRKAFYINAYNLLVINKVVAALPIASVMDVLDFFDKKDVAIEGTVMSLNDLEKGTLFADFPDNRLHFVLVCGAVGCPPIISQAYRPATLESQLETQTIAAMDDPSFINESGGKTGVSQIFNWYSADFGGSDSAIIKYINTYKTDKLSSTTRIEYTDYDWSLNKQ